MQRGEIWLADFGEAAFPGEPKRIRPALIVSSHRLNATRMLTVVGVPLTTQGRQSPLHIEVEAEGLDEPSYAQPELVMALARQRLIHRLAVASDDVVRAVDDELRSVLAL